MVCFIIVPWRRCRRPRVEWCVDQSAHRTPGVCPVLAGPHHAVRVPRCPSPPASHHFLQPHTTETFLRWHKTHTKQNTTNNYTNNLNHLTRKLRTSINTKPVSVCSQYRCFSLLFIVFNVQSSELWHIIQLFYTAIENNKPDFTETKAWFISYIQPGNRTNQFYSSQSPQLHTNTTSMFTVVLGCYTSTLRSLPDSLVIQQVGVEGIDQLKRHSLPVRLNKPHPTNSLVPTVQLGFFSWANHQPSLQHYTTYLLQRNGIESTSSNSQL